MAKEQSAERESSIDWHDTDTYDHSGPPDAWNTLVELVRQLQDYKKHLGPIDAVCAEITALQASSLRVTDDAVRQLHVDAAGNALHSDTVDAVTAELADLNANLAARLRTLRQSLTATTNGLAISAP